MANITSITFEADGTTITVDGGDDSTGNSYDLSKNGDADITITNKRSTDVTVNLVSVENFTTGNIILKSDGTGTGTIIIDGDKDNNGNIQITRDQNDGHSLFEMNTINPTIDVSIKNINVEITGNFNISGGQSGGILSIKNNNGLDNDIEIDNCNVKATGNITIGNGTRDNGGILGFPYLATENQECNVSIKNCDVIAVGEIKIGSESGDSINNGGIMGGFNIAENGGTGTVTIDKCNVTAESGNIEFNGNLNGHNGGIMGCQVVGLNGGTGTVTITNCNVTASGNIVIGTITGFRNGGIMGCFNVAINGGTGTVTIENCNVTAESGNIESKCCRKWRNWNSYY
jgi:hypothetical protein